MYETWAIIFFKVYVFRTVFDVSLSLLNGWISAQAKMRMTESLDKVLNDVSEAKEKR
jgi:hypothetical protein